MKTKRWIIILLIGISFIGVSYAYFNASETQEQANVIGTKCFEVSMASEGEEITLNEAYPVTDEDGKNQKGYTFTIKNTCNTKASYEVNLEELAVTKKLSNEHIKVSINESKGSIVGELKESTPTIAEADTSHTLTSGSLNPNESKQYTIKLWMDEETPPDKEYMEAKYKSKVTITNTYEENTLNEMTIAHDTLETNYVKDKERIKVTGTSDKYNIIEYSFDDSSFEKIKPESKKVEQVIEVTDENKIYPFIYRDEKGNEKIENIKPTMLDQTGPNIEVQETGTEEGASLTITFTDNKSGLKEYIVLEETDEEEWISLESSGTVTYQSPTNKKITIKAKDNLDNESEKEYNITLADTKGPEITLTSTLTDWGQEDSIHIQATDKSGIKEVKVNKEDTSIYEDTPDNLTEYNHDLKVTENGTYTVIAKDLYDNESSKEIEIEYIDKESPEIEFQETIDNDKVKVVTNATDNIEVTRYRYQIDEEEWIEKTEKEHTFEKVSEGQHTIRVEAFDKAGNKSETKEKSIQVYYDRKIEIVGLNSTIENGITINNQIKNGSFENDELYWSKTPKESDNQQYGVSGSLNSSVVKSGRQSYYVKDVDNQGYWTYQKFMNQPNVNDKLYAKISSKLLATNGSNGGIIITYDYKQLGTIGFGTKINEDYQELGVLATQTEARPVYVQFGSCVYCHDEVYVDDIYALNLTRDFGAGNELSKEWLDKNLEYFDSKAGYISKTIKSNESTNITITPENGYVFESMECDHATVNRNENSYTITNPTADTVCKIKYKEQKVEITIQSETSTIQDGKVLNNLVRNGSFENDGLYWSTSTNYQTNNAISGEISSVQKVHGEKSLYVKDEFDNRGYWTHQFFETQPAENAQIYLVGSVYPIKQNGTHLNLWLAYNTSSTSWSGGAVAGLFDSYNMPLNVWTKGSKIISKGNKTVFIQLGSSNTQLLEFYMDEIYGIDLTKDIGSSIPSKDWLDNHIQYFPSTSTLYQSSSYINGERYIKIDIDSGYQLSKVECSNSTATYQNEYLRIQNIKDEVICHLETKDASEPTQNFAIGTHTQGENGWYKTLQVNVNVNGGASEVVLANYCTTTDNTCNPDQKANISNNSFTVTLNNNPKAQKVCAQVTNGNGTKSKVTCSGSYSVDNEAPSAAIKSAKANKDSIVIDASTSSDANSKVKTYMYSINGQTWQSSTTSSYTFTKVSDGNYTIQVKVKDTAGNESSVVKSSQIKVDATGPTIQFAVASQSKDSNRSWYKSLSLKATISDAGVGPSTSIKYCLDTKDCTPNNTVTTTNNGYTVALNNGEKSRLCVTATDTNNNSKTLCSSTYNVDGVTPTLTMVNTGTKDFGDTNNIATATYGPSKGTVSCINTTMGNAAVTTFKSINGIGTFGIRCTATSNAGINSASQNKTYNIQGTLTPDMLSVTPNGSKTSTEIKIPNNVEQYGPYYKTTPGCYKVTYTGSNFNGTCNQFRVYQNLPSITYTPTSLIMTDTTASYYVSIPSAADNSGLEFNLLNNCSNTATVKNIKIEKVSTCPTRTYEYDFVASTDDGIGDSSTHSTAGNKVYMKVHNSFQTNYNFTMAYRILNLYMINPTLSFDYTFTPSASDRSNFFITNGNGQTIFGPIYRSTSGHKDIQLSGTINHLEFILVSNSNYTGEITISNLKLNGISITF